MDSESNRTGERTTPNKVQMFVFATIGVSALLRLPSQDSGPMWWLNIFLLVIGVVGFAAAALGFDRKL